jgi:hypothetical protein
MQPVAVRTAGNINEVRGYQASLFWEAAQT